MTLEQIDRELADWRQRLRLANDNLDDFERLPAFVFVRGNIWTGTTADRAGGAEDVLRELRREAGLLNDIIARASLLRASLSVPAPAKSIAEIERLLEGASIEYGQGAIPPDHRELLRPVQTVLTTTPRKLIEAMLESFRQLRDAVLAVEHAAARMQGKVAALEADVASLNMPGLPQSPELAEAERVISELMRSSTSDPLGALPQAEMAEALVQTARRNATACLSLAQAVTGSLANADGLLEQIRRTHDRALLVCAERAEKIEVGEGTIFSQPPDQSSIDSLTVWLGRLQQAFAEGKWQTVSADLPGWTRAAENHLAIEERVIAENQSALDTRRDLRGLLDALIAKACTRGNGAETDLHALAEQAMQLLRRRPTPIARAQALVDEYESRLL